MTEPQTFKDSASLLKKMQADLLNEVFPHFITLGSLAIQRAVADRLHAAAAKLGQPDPILDDPVVFKFPPRAVITSLGTAPAAAREAYQKALADFMLAHKSKDRFLQLLRTVGIK